MSLGYKPMICVVFSMFVGVSPAAAATAVCAPHDVVVSRLAEHYNEAPRLRGRTQTNRIVDVFASPNFETWSLTFRHENGKTCLFATGQGRPALDDNLAGDMVPLG
ncbi:MAG: hypothetical protein AAFV62_08610 [Pseudomonadota bacterium]